MAAEMQNGFIRAFFKDVNGNVRSRTYDTDKTKMATSTPELQDIATAFVTGIQSLVGAEVTYLEVGGVITETGGAPLKAKDGTDECSIHSAVKVTVSLDTDPDNAKTYEFLGCYRDLYKKRLGSNKKSQLPIQHEDTPSTPGGFLHAMMIDQGGTGKIKFLDKNNVAVDTATDGLHLTKQSSVSPGIREA